RLRAAPPADAAAAALRGRRGWRCDRPRAGRGAGMSLTATPRAPWRAARLPRVRARPGLLAAAAAPAAVLALTALAAVMRARTAIGAPLWIDEGISVGIAKHALTTIPGLLRQDGSPPVYYLLLHCWMAIFGSTPTSTHALSIAFAVLAVPASAWAAW